VAHRGFEHSPREQPPVAHTLPQAPQLLGSVMISIHWSPQVALGAAHAKFDQWIIHRGKGRDGLRHDVAVAISVLVVVVVGVTVAVAVN
jgi:uncharacterized membrane protein YidH (DUF202 family)